MPENTENQKPTDSGQEQTFTQAELNKIVQERVFREKEKYQDYEDLKAKAAKLDEIEESSKSELQKITDKAAKLQAELDGIKNAEKIRLMREKVASETKVPASLLTGETEDDCKAQAQAILEYAKPNYPNLKDGGEMGGGSNPGATRDKFAEWANAVFV